MQCKKFTKLIILMIFFSSFAFAADGSQMTRSAQIKQFKKSQTCYVSSVDSEQWAIALDCAKNSLDAGRELFSSGHKNIAALIHNYALMLDKNKQPNKAVDEFEKAYKLYKKLYGKNSETLGWLLLDLADSQVKYDSKQASKNYLKSLEILSLQESFDPLIKAEISLEASVYLTGKSLTKRALKNTLIMAQFAYETYFNAYGANHSQTALAAFTMGKISYLKNDDALAVKYLKQSLVSPAISKYAHAILVDIHTKNGRIDLAQKHQKALGNDLPKQSGESKYVPVFVQSPVYPRNAQIKGVEGYAIVELTITKDGGVKDPVLIKEYPSKWGFGKSALKVVKKLKYVPQVKDGLAIEVANVKYKYSFKMHKAN